MTIRLLLGIILLAPQGIVWAQGFQTRQSASVKKPTMGSVQPQQTRDSRLREIEKQLREIRARREALKARKETLLRAQQLRNGSKRIDIQKDKEDWTSNVNASRRQFNRTPSSQEATNISNFTSTSTNSLFVDSLSRKSADAWKLYERYDEDAIRRINNGSRMNGLMAGNAAYQSVSNSVSQRDLGISWQNYAATQRAYAEESRRSGDLKRAAEYKQKADDYDRAAKPLLNRR